MVFGPGGAESFCGGVHALRWLPPGGSYPGSVVLREVEWQFRVDLLNTITKREKENSGQQ